MANAAKLNGTLTAQQIDIVMGKARYERSKVFHGHLQALATFVAKTVAPLVSGQGRPATS